MALLGVTNAGRICPIPVSVNMLSHWLSGEFYLPSSLVAGGDFSLEMTLVDGAPFSLLCRPQVEIAFGGDLIGW